MKKILISGLGGSLFPYLHNQLKNKYELYYVDSNSALAKVYSDYNFFPAPLINSGEYKNFINKIIKEKQIEVYMPLIDEEILLAHEIKKENPTLFLFSPNFDFSKLCLNKYLLMKKLAELNLSFIDSMLGSDFKWGNHKSIFVKPINGRGSRGIRHIQTPEELQAYYTLEKCLPGNVLIQENIKGIEYTVGLMSNKNNEVISIVPKKVISKKGITIEAVVDNDSSIIELSHKINQALKPQGAINIQLYKTKEDELKIFEINPRFSTTSIMSFAAGINEVELLLNNFNLYSESIRFAPQGLRLIRRWENLFYVN